MMGSDWPHGEETATPAAYADSLEGMTPEQVRQILRDNGVALLGLE